MKKITSFFKNRQKLAAWASTIAGNAKNLQGMDWGYSADSSHYIFKLAFYLCITTPQAK